MDRKEAVLRLRDKPYLFGHALGFTKLTELHNEWIQSMIVRGDDETLQAHRGSYKTTCVSIALALIMILFPNDKTLFMRKTESDVKEIVQQVKKILESQVTQYFVKAIYGVQLRLTVSNSNELSTNLCTDPRGTSQLIATGVNGSLTGKHFDRIFTDDIVNLQDRISTAERNHTKQIYQELQNIKNRGGRIFNTGTPWHKDDAFSIMPAAKVFDCYSTGLISDEELAEIKAKMEGSLFAANYEMKHIASDDILFFSPTSGAESYLVEQGICHVDASYGGADGTAFTICNKKDGKYFILGKLWHKHVDDCMDDMLRLRSQFNCGKIYCEDNGDKGYLAKALRQRGERVQKYHENMNKYIKITSYLKAEWGNVVFVDGTDAEYIDQICDYNENAEHDDAPDSLSCCVRVLWNKKERSASDGNNLFLL